MLILYDFSRPKHFIQDPKPNPNFSRFCKFCFYRTHSDRSTGSRPALDRHAQNVHVRISRPAVDRYSTDPNLLLSGNCQSTDPVDRQFIPGYRSTEPVDRWLQRSEKWPLAGRPAVDRQHWHSPNGSIFWEPIKGGFVYCFKVKILEISWAVFLILLEEFSPQNRVLILPIKREFLSREC